LVNTPAADEATAFDRPIATIGVMLEMLTFQRTRMTAFAQRRLLRIIDRLTDAG